MLWAALWLAACCLAHTQDAMASESSTASLKGLQATGKAGPLELRLELPKKDVPRGGRIHFRLTLRNVGKKPVVVSDYAFKNPKFFANNRDREHASYLVVVGRNGEDVYFSSSWVTPMFCPHDPISIAPGSVVKEVDPSPEDDPFAYLDKWKRDNPEASNRVLKAGESVTSPAWAAPRWLDCVETPQVLAGDFTELWNVDLKQPGSYRVKAVFDATISPRLKAKFPKYFARQQRIDKDISSSDVRVETPWLEVLVP